jgi:hypothetical protein
MYTMINNNIIKDHPPKMIHRTAIGPMLVAAFVSLRIATNTDVQRMQVKDAVRK